jgi:hypothetical protein
MTAPTNIDGAMMQVTEKDVIETCEVHGFPLDPNQLEVVTAVVNQILLSARKPAAKSCQTGWADICHMAKHDGVTCPDDSCDIDDGIRAAPAQSGEPVEADVVPNEIAELLTEPCWNLSRRDVSDLLKRIGSILYTAPQPSRPVEAGEPVGKNALTLTGAQLLEALDFIAPDRSTDAEQLESEVAIEYGEGHSGKAMYCWCAEYPEEGSLVLDGKSIDAAPQPSQPAEAGEDHAAAREHFTRQAREAAERLTQAQSAVVLDDERIDWIANAHCPGGTAWPNNVKAAIRDALNEARAASPQATATQPAQTERALTDWQDGVGLLWDVYDCNGKWFKRVVSPIGWDAYAVHQHMCNSGYAPHIDIRLVSSMTNASPDEPVAQMERTWRCCRMGCDKPSVCESLGECRINAATHPASGEKHE